MRFLRIICKGAFNSFRQPDFHTYHKTLPLPPKTTVGGLIGSALGISPREVNDEWLLTERFKMGIVGSNNGQANDLWQIRKYESKQIKAYQIGKEKYPYKTAVIVRELLYQGLFTIYLSFEKKEDYELVHNAFKHPKWALSLGREDELIRIIGIEQIEIRPIISELSYKNTIFPGDITEISYRPDLSECVGNLLIAAPKTVNIPISFVMEDNSEARKGNDYQKFTYVGALPILVNSEGYFDNELNQAFQIF